MTRRRKRGCASEAEILALLPTLRALTWRMRQSIPALRSWDHEDLVQEAYLRVYMALEGFQGDSSLKTWAVGMVRNVLISQARHLALHPKPIGDAVECYSGRRSEDIGQKGVLRSETKRLLTWLKHNPDGIPQGWEVFNILLKTQGDFNYASLALSVHTGSPWTVERVRNTVRAIRATSRGQALCESLGIACFSMNNEE
jgi:RNA polymerase sigma factor (sigma-70 family)